jgi:hypothetical protein
MMINARMRPMARGLDLIRGRYSDASVGANTSGAFGENTSGGAPNQNPNAFNYGGSAGGAQAAQNQYAQQQQLAQNAAAPQSVIGSPAYKYYQQQLAMTPESANNLGTAELNQATAQGIAAQRAQAASAGGSLGGALASRNAAQQGVASQNAANQQAAINTIQQQQQAAGQLQQAGQYQAGLQEQQNALNANTGLAYAGLGQNVAQSQLAAQEAGQQYNLQQAAQNNQSAQFNAKQNQNLAGAVGGAIGQGLSAIGSFFDADFKEPGGGAAFTIREERGGPHHAPFLAVIDRTTGRAGKIQPAPLSPEEHAQLYAPHGAGPLDSPQRMRTEVHDMGLGAGATGGAPPSDISAATMGASLGGQARGPGQAIGSLASSFAGGGGTVGAIPQARMYSDMDLAGGRYGDFTTVPSNVSMADLAADAQGFNEPTPDLPPAPIAGTMTPGGSRPANSFVTDPAKWAQPEVRPAPGSSPRPKLVFGGGQSNSAVGPSDPGTAPVPGGAGGGPSAQAWVPNAPPGTISAIQAANAAHQQGADMVAQADRQAIQIEGELHGRNAADEAIEGARQESSAKNFDRHIADLERKRQDYSEAMSKAEEGYGWHPSTTKRIMYGIASILGGFGADLTHGQNHAQETINGEIDRELDRQKMAIEGAKGRVANMDTALAEAYRRTGHMDSAMALAKATALQQNAERAIAMDAASKDLGVQARAKIAAADWMKQSAEELARFYAHASVGGGAMANDLKAETEAFHKHVAEEASKPGGKALTWNEWDANWRHGGGQSQATAAGKGAQLSPRLNKNLSDLDAQERAAVSLKKLLDSGSSASLSDRGRAESMSNTLRNGGYANVPEHPLEVFSSSGARRDALEETLKDIRLRRQQIEARAPNTSAASSEAEQ